MKRRILAILLILSMILGMVSTVVYATEEETENELELEEIILDEEEDSKIAELMEKYEQLKKEIETKYNEYKEQAIDYYEQELAEKIQEYMNQYNELKEEVQKKYNEYKEKVIDYYEENASEEFKAYMEKVIDKIQEYKEIIQNVIDNILGRDEKIMADIEELNKAILKAEDYIYGDTRYTEKSMQALKDAYNSATTFLDEKDLEELTIEYQEEIDELTKAINDAINNLELFHYEEIGTYDVLDGENQTFNLNKDTSLTFRFNIEYSAFKKDGKVYIDDEYVSEDNYTSKEGSTIITFKDEYLKTLDDGEHTLVVALSDEYGTYGKATTKFTISKAEVAETENVEKNETKPTKISYSPKTGDNVAIYTSLLAIASLGVAVILINRKNLMKAD